MARPSRATSRPKPMPARRFTHGTRTRPTLCSKVTYGQMPSRAATRPKPANATPAAR